MPDREHGQPAAPGRRGDGQRPGQRGAPVVADHGGPLDPERVEQAEHVGDQGRHRVGGRRRPGGPTAEPAQVRRDHPVPGRDQRRDLVPPQRRRVREAVQQQHRGPAALVDHLERQAVGRDPHAGPPRALDRVTAAAGAPDPAAGSGTPASRQRCGDGSGGALRRPAHAAVRSALGAERAGRHLHPVRRRTSWTRSGTPWSRCAAHPGAGPRDAHLDHRGPGRPAAGLRAGRPTGGVRAQPTWSPLLDRTGPPLDQDYRSALLRIGSAIARARGPTGAGSPRTTSRSCCWSPRCWRSSRLRRSPDGLLVVVTDPSGCAARSGTAATTATATSTGPGCAAACPPRRSPAARTSPSPTPRPTSPRATRT